MPDLSEESLWHWGCLTSSLRDTGEPAWRRVEAVFGFGLNALDSSPLLKFLLPSQLLKVKQGYSPSVVYFFRLLSCASTTKPQWWKQSQHVCEVWVFGMQGVCLECSMPEERHLLSWAWAGWQLLSSLSNKDAPTRYAEMGRLHWYR